MNGSTASATAGGASRAAVRTRPLVVHVVYRFDTGGLENGIVNLINHMPEAAYRHAVLALTDVSPAFGARIRRRDVDLLSLHKPPGHALALYPRIWSTLRRLRPAVVHTRNLAALECQIPAWAAGVPARVHSEHGRDVADLDGSNRRHQFARRLYKPFVHHQLALSHDLHDYLRGAIGVPAARLTQVYNGVDTERFQPAATRTPDAGCPFTDPALWVVGTVGRMQAVKNQPLLVRAFIRALEQRPELRARLRLALVGSGPLQAECEALLDAAGVRSLAWLPGERSDVPEVMRSFDCFALPSLAEGISNTILEAMASGLPVIATDVGGNADLVQSGSTGCIVGSGDVDAMAMALAESASEVERFRTWGRAGRAAAERRFSMQAMVSAYQDVYDRLLLRGIRRGEGH